MKSDLRDAFMPEIITIADFGKRSRKPLTALRTPVKMAEVDGASIRRAVETVKTALMKKAIAQIRLALMALANGRFEEAGQLAVNSAIEAAAAFKQNPMMGARIFATARAVVRSAVRGIMARSA